MRPDDDGARLRAPRSKLAAAVVLACWAAATVWWLDLALRYQATPGARSAAATRLPDSARLSLDRARPTLVVAAHPHCPCTRATIEQLARVAARCDGGLRMHVLFYSDPRMGPNWCRSDLWERVEAIPGAAPVEDPLGRTASLIGARTSGHAFLFDPDGELRFEGGLTDARGHEGDSTGAAAVVRLWMGGTPEVSSTPVFGCSLAGES